MNEAILKDAGIAYDIGVKRFVGRVPLYEKALKKFLRDTTFERIAAAYDAGDAQQLFANVHEFKGMCGNIALTSLHMAAEEMTRLLRGDAYTQADLAAAYAHLSKEYRAVRGVILAAMEDGT